jgi:rhodanese-related sulfurtransferase
MFGSGFRGVVNVSHADLKKGLADGSIVYVDVREPHEFNNVRVPGSVNLPLSMFEPERLAIPEGAKVVFGCAAGVRSRKAVDLAVAMGFPFTAHYPGGMKGWVEAGEPFDRG